MKSDFNLILDTDSYKASHWLQYPPGTTYMFSYLESRVGGKYDKTVFFGLQYFLEKYLSEPVTVADVYAAAEFFKAHGEPFNMEGWLRVAIHHRGKLPVKIRAVPEGSVIPTGNIMLSVESTDPKCFWVVSWIETMVMRLWYPITVATQSYHIKQNILEYLNKTSDDPQGQIAFKLHDFGSRGVSSAESAGIGGAAHLVNFMGSDTVNGVVLANKHYRSPMAGFSIPAAEHSSITSWGQENEVEAYRNMLKQFAKPGSLVAVVSDSYDIFKAVDNLWGDKLRQEVIDSGATVVIRPDSGDPVFVVNTIMHTLDKKFGHTVNKKGFKVLNNVRVIQGDGVNDYTINAILKSITMAGFSADNIAFGMGGALLQQVNRDTQRFAFKCSMIRKGDVEVDVSKNPATDPTKKSKAGHLDLVYDNGYKTVKTGTTNAPSLLQTVYENGEILVTTTLDEVRARTKETMV